MITSVAPADFNFLIEVSFEAREMIRSFGLSSLAVKTINRLSASSGNVVMSALACSIPASCSAALVVASACRRKAMDFLKSYRGNRDHGHVQSVSKIVMLDQRKTCCT